MRPTLHYALLSAAILPVLSAVPVLSQTGVTGGGVQLVSPPMSGVTEGGMKMATSDEFVTYSIQDVGVYVTPAGNGTPQNIDQACQARPVIIRSLQPGTVTITKQRQSDGGLRYLVSGVVQHTPGLYTDVWVMQSTHPGSGPDTPQSLFAAQQVIVGKSATTPRSQVVQGADAAQAPGLPSAAGDLTERETASAALRPRLLHLLIPAQQSDLRHNREVVLPLRSLPTELRQQALKYVQHFGDGSWKVLQIGGLQNPETCLAYNLVLLPSRQNVIGVDSPASSDGTASHF